MNKTFSRQSSTIRVGLACFVVFLLLQTINYNLQPIYAVDSSQSASGSADIKSKLKALQEEIASRAANMKTEVAKKLQNKAYIGQIKDKNSTSITLENNRNVNINEFTEYVVKSKTYTGGDGFKNIALGNSIAALGDIDDKGILTAKRIIKLGAPIPPLKKIIHGIVISISGGKATLKNIQGEQYSIAFDKKTDYQMGKSDGKLDDIRMNTWLIVVAEPLTGSDILQAKFVYIFPYALKTKPKPSTPSATKKST